MIATHVTFASPRHVKIGTVNVPPPAPDEVQIETLFSGISSGTEGWALRNEFTWMPTPYSCIPGYQRVGIITALGSEVSGFQIGQRVFATMAQPVDGLHMMWGGHMSVANTLAGEVFPLDPAVDDIDAASGVVAQVGYNAASRLTLTPGEWVVVYGDGLIGQGAAQAARLRGYRVILVGHRDKRLELGARYSADHTINRKTTAVPIHEAILAITGGSKIRGLLDSVQTVSSEREYVAFLENGVAQITYCGFTPGEAWADMALLQQKQLTTHYVSGWTGKKITATLQAMASGHIHMKELMTHIIPCTEAARAYDIIESKAAESLGVTLDWTH